MAPGTAQRCFDLINRPPGSAHFTYIIIYIRYSVDARDTSSAALPEVSSIVLFSCKKFFFLNMAIKTEDVARYADCKAY